MKKMNVIVIFNKDFEKTLMCKRTKEPYMGMYNLVGGKIEKENDGLNEAYRELEEETNITKKDVSLVHFMHLTYSKWNKELEVYYGILNKEVELIEEVNNSNGEAISIKYVRNNQTMQTSITPVKSDNEYKIGLWVRDAAAGVRNINFL